MIVGLHSSVFGKSILEWVCCAWWWELGHTICLVCLPAWCVWLQPNTDLCRWRIWATWSVQLQWAVLQSHLLVFSKDLDCLHLPHGLWFLHPTGKASPLLTCWQCSASCSPGSCWPLLRGSTDRTWSPWCSPVTPGCLLTFWSSSSQPSAFICLSVYSCPGVALWISFCLKFSSHFLHSNAVNC